MKTVEDLINLSNLFDNLYDIHCNGHGFSIVHESAKQEVINIAHEYSNQFKSWIDGYYKKPSDYLPVMCFDEITRTQIKGQYCKTLNCWKAEGSEQILKVRYWHYLLPNPQ